MNRKILFCNILTVMLFLLTKVPLYAQNNIVHAYTPFTIPQDRAEYPTLHM